MDLPYKRQSQFELFPGTSANPGEMPRHPIFLRQITLPPENIIVLCIIVLMVFVLSFSLGVERGRKVAGHVTEPQEKILLQSKNNAIIPPLSNSATIPGKTGKQSITAAVNPAAKAASSNVPTPMAAGVTASVQKTIPGQPPVGTPVVAQSFENYNYTIQVASFKQVSFAQKEVDRLKANGLDAFVMNKGSYSIVCVGKFVQTAQAKKMAGQLKGRYKDYLIRSL